MSAHVLLNLLNELGKIYIFFVNFNSKGTFTRHAIVCSQCCCLFLCYIKE